MGTQLDNQKNLVKKKQKTSLPPLPVAGSTRAHSSRSAPIAPGVDDHRFGRIDMAGKSIAGYPTIRGDVSGPNGRTSREGGPTAKGENHDTARPCTRHKNRWPGLSSHLNTLLGEGRAMDGPGLCKVPTAHCTTRGYPSRGCPAVTFSPTSSSWNRRCCSSKSS